LTVRKDVVTPPTAPPPPRPAARRLLAPTDDPSLAAHDRRHGRLPSAGRELIDEVERSGLLGAGGARFPTGRKLRAVAAGKRPVVVANGCEGEPASHKDKTLLAQAPHLVLDGASAAAAAVGADRIHLCIERGHPALARELRAKIDERAAARRDGAQIVLHEVPDRYVAGEESALVHWLNGGEAKPTTVPPRPFERGVGRRPTLVDNVETLAQLGLIARHGAAWFRSAGTPDLPGTTLLTITGGVTNPGVYEVPGGMTLPDVLRHAGGSLETTQALLLGGYFGTWMSAADASSLSIDPPSLARAGASLGCGIVVALPPDVCGLAESARVVDWLSRQSAGQCGPCVHGLDAMAQGMAALVARPAGGWVTDRLTQLMGLVERRGACRLPDGAVRFAASSLTVFAEHAALHDRRGPCPERSPVLPTPTSGGWR
jgi:NADH:ubiquinone oxidoreductase subunit F (NADH-binding)